MFGFYPSLAIKNNKKQCMSSSANLNQIIHPQPKKCQCHLVKHNKYTRVRAVRHYLDTSCFSNLPDKGQHRTKHSAQLLEFECLRPSTPQSLRRILCQRICAWGEPLQKCAALLSFTSATQVSQLISVMFLLVLNFAK